MTPLLALLITLIGHAPEDPQQAATTQQQPRHTEQRGFPQVREDAVGGPDRTEGRRTRVGVGNDRDLAAAVSQGSSPEGPPTVVSWLLLLVTGCLAWYTRGLFQETQQLALQAKTSGDSQTLAMQASVDAAVRAALAMEDSVRLARASAEQQLRAYLGVIVGGCMAKLSCDGTVEGTFAFKNFGRSPAKDVEVEWQMAIGADDFDPTAAPADTAAADKNMSRGGLWPDDTAGFQFQWPTPIPEGHLRALKAGRAWVYLISTITYADPFEGARVTHVCMYFPFDPDKRGTLTAGVIHSKGNHAT